MKIGQPNSYKSILNNLNINYIRNDNLIDFNLNNKYKISSFKVIHGELKNCCGYTFNNIISFTGDTSYCESIKNISKRTKYLVADSTMQKGDINHMGVDNIKDLAKNKDLNIITTHMSVNSEKLLEKTIFINNNVELAKDGKIFYIKTN